MNLLDSPLHRLALSQNSNKLSPPTSRNADLDAWRIAYGSILSPSLRDTQLATAALYYGIQVRQLRIDFDSKTLAGLGRRTATLLAVAELNRSLDIITQKGQKFAKKARGHGAIALDHVANLPVPHITAGQSVSVADISDATVDTVDVWLHQCNFLEPHDAEQIDLQYTRVSAMARFSVEQGISDLWRQVLWQGWYLNKVGNTLVHTPRDRSAETLRFAWAYRHMNLFSQAAILAARDWRNMMSPQERQDASLKRTVVGLQRHNAKRIEYLIGKPPQINRQPSLYYLNIVSLENSYIGIFLDVELPFVKVTLRLLCQAWSILDDLAKHIGKFNKTSTQIPCSNIRSQALLIEKSDIVNIIRDCLNTSRQIANVVVGFFSWSATSYKGLWGAPLVPICNSTKLAVAQLPLANSNMMRWAEIMMKKGGLSDDISSKSKGIPFENIARNKVKTAVENNAILRNTACASHALKRRNAGEEIDLLLYIDGLLIVGEIKCWLFPADPSEYYRQYQKLEKAAEQTSRKAKWAAANTRTIASHLNLDYKDNLINRIVPIVIQNQGFGSSLSYCDCKIIDLSFFCLLLGSSHYVSGAALHADGREIYNRTILYKTCDEFLEKFDYILQNPPPLKDLVSRIFWRNIQFPTYTGAPFYIETAELDDIGVQEKSLTWLF